MCFCTKLQPFLLKITLKYDDTLTCTES